MKTNRSTTGRVTLNQARVTAFLLAMTCAQAWAQVGGGTGTGSDVQARVVSTMTTFQAIMFAIGGFVISATAMWTGYGMATGNKKWADCANVCYGAGFAGCAVMIAGWLFS